MLLIIEKSCARGYINLHQKQTSYRQSKSRRAVSYRPSQLSVPTVHPGYNRQPICSEVPIIFWSKYQIPSTPVANSYLFVQSSSIVLFFSFLFFLSCCSVSAESAANTSPKLGLGAHGAAVASIRASIAVLAMEDIASAADADMSSCHLVTGSNAVVLGVKRHRGLLACAMDVASSADAAEEAARGGGSGGCAGGDDGAV